MSRPIFLRGEDGKIKKVIRHEDKNIARKRGFNSSSDGFTVAPPVKPIAPTPAPHFPDGTPVTAENRGFEGGNWEAQHNKFQEAISERRTCPECNGAGCLAVQVSDNGEPEQAPCQACDCSGFIDLESN